LRGSKHSIPNLRGRFFYETLPPGILHKQIAAGGMVTLGDLTLAVKPDIYEAGARVLYGMAQQGQSESVVEYATNTLAIMLPAFNPKQIDSLKDLGRPDARLSMPNREWEGVANQIEQALRNAGGEDLYQTVYQRKVKDGTNKLTEIHHRPTPMRIMEGKADAGVVWASEVKFQESVGNPITGVAIPEAQNETATYTAGVLMNAPHAAVARQWLTYLESAEAQGVYHQFGFKSVEKRGR
jgi:ABC-type molybdate transport system substrate-binding protein